MTLRKLTTNFLDNKINLEKDIDFILSHFDNATLFPRTMMTKKRNYQFNVYSKEEIVKGCIDSNYIDCRINAYPSYTRWEKYEMVRYPPNFIFIDIDLSNFSRYKNPRNILDRILSNTLEKISSPFLPERSYHSQHSQLLYPNSNNIQDGHEESEVSSTVKPTVLWSGNGYHIYLPINALVLDQYTIFSRDKFPGLFSNKGKYYNHSVSETFMHFAEQYFSNGRADPQHRSGFRSCLIRIPNTVNSKCIEKGLLKDQSKVKINQRWNGYRPPIQLLTKYFLRWLYQEEIDQKKRLKNMRLDIGYKLTTRNHQIRWIEELLQIGIYDGRKESLRLILAPYLVNILRKDPDITFRILTEWLKKCESERELDFSIRFLVNETIECSIKKGIPPMRLETIRSRNYTVYSLIKERINLTNR
ncbi:DNA primase noncatalytic subunit PriX [Candidatus Nitrosocosmicus hydrocola]|uniref:DNA primase noncatalytic subunit PriX n=1 Tax=Candidatus Nitrosocosmicus hydrocola TaxID=1826872 RepID=UPI0011E5D941|nr:DNA primase noncatalytic subunit PriX [Candidatus Nitrosocosmicus hydrocola]